MVERFGAYLLPESLFMLQHGHL
jgi:hypothetical protein